MSRLTSMRGVFAVLAVLICGPAFATAYTSNQSGDWSLAATWAPAGVPAAGDQVSITGSHVITVSDTRSVDSITWLNNSGNKELHVTSTGDLTVLGTLTSVLVNPSTDGTNWLVIDGGLMSVTNGSVSVVGGALSVARVRFTTNGGRLAIFDDLLFSGNITNAHMAWDGGSAGILEIGGDLSSGGTITTGGSASTVKFKGTGSQTINPYTFENFTVDKSSGTATLNGAITINGNLSIPNGVFDDGGYLIALDTGLASQVNVGANGVLKLGSEFFSTPFPSPFTPANVTLNSGSAVVYQAGVPQVVEDSIQYQRLFLQKIGAANVTRTISNNLLKAIQELYIDAGVTLVLDGDVLDVDGNINGNGTIQLNNSSSAASMTVGGNWSGGTLTAASGTTVTYDGSGAQVMRGVTYQHMVVNKPSGDLTLDTGSATVMGALSLISGNVIVSGTSFTIDLNATVTRTSGHFVGPLTMTLPLTPPQRFEVGTASSYLPVDVDPNIAGTLTIKAADAPHPNATGINTLDRYWTLTPGTITNLDSIQFNYNQSDVTNGAETQYRLAHYNGATWADHGDIPETLNYGQATGVSAFTGDWVIGQRGSTGFAGKIAITSVNGGVDPTVNTPFDVDVQTQHDDGTPANVTSNSTIDVLLNAGGGSLLGASASLNSGTSSGTATGLTYDTVESNVQLNASSGSGDSLDPGVSALFDVVAAVPSTLIVTSTSDTGAGSLRDAITAYNSGGCTIPCTITFASTGTGNIVLGSQLPVLTGGQLTIDGFSGNGAQPNTNAFSQPLNSVITVSLDGNNTVPYGLIIQSANTTIKGLGFRNFNFGGTGEAIKIDGVSGCSIAGNYIGTDNSGAADEGNYFGVVINGAGATGNVIGGNNPADRNLISGNVLNGIVISNASSNGVSNNFIGTAADGTSALGNGGHGISLTGSTSDTTIGLTANRIAFNALKGVEVNTTGVGNLIRENEIYSNTGIAIDLGTDGPTANVTGDADTGPNNLQNYPDISSAQITGVTTLDVTLSLDSSGGVNANFFVIDIYKADGSSPSQAAEYLGASGCLAGVLTNQVVTVPLGSVTVGSQIVATATAYGGAACTGASEGTSELSPGFTINGDVFWINGAGGAWENGANWDTGNVPGPGDNAFIDLVGTYTVTLGSSQTVKSLTLGNGVSGAQTLQVTGGPLTLNGASSITSTGVLDLSSSIQGSGTLTNNGTFNWNTGTISLAVTNNTANMTLGTGSAKALTGTTLTNSIGASISWTGGTINIGTGGSI
ncbi:MAG TPA: hypothetical protein VFV49_10630, partial [Thermoanaerobaculia bacterium]|nr:hypothetical protein [Thermoanaerobaculia bacterium]